MVKFFLFTFVLTEFFFSVDNYKMRVVREKTCHAFLIITSYVVHGTNSEPEDQLNVVSNYAKMRANSCIKRTYEVWDSFSQGIISTTDFILFVCQVFFLLQFFIVENFHRKAQKGKSDKNARQ